MLEYMMESVKHVPNSSVVTGSQRNLWELEPCQNCWMLGAVGWDNSGWVYSGGVGK